MPESPAATRYSVGVEFLVTADSPEDARSMVSNFADSFPSQVDEAADGDVIVQDVEESE